MDRSPGFGSIIYDLNRPIQTRSRFGSIPYIVLNLAIYNNSLDRSTKSTISHIYSALSACKHRVSGSFSLPSRGSFHLSLTVLITIGHQVVFSLTGWSPLFHTRFLVSRTTLDSTNLCSLFIYWTFTFYGMLSQTFLLNLQIVYCSPNPRSITTSGLGSSYFARHYFRNRVFFLFLWVLRCFSSPRYLLIHYFTHVWVIRLFLLIEFPHSDIYGYNGYLLLPVAFRSLSRPSSALGA